MGLLKAGKPLPWGACVEHSEYIRQHGIQQFLATWRRLKDLANDRLYYGDEVEYAVLKVDQERREVRLSLRAGEIMAVLNSREQGSHSHTHGCTWHQEYGSWMIEGTPAVPYDGYTSSLVQVEQNMRLRRARLLAALAPDEIAPTVVNHSLLGVGDFTYPPAAPGGPVALSDNVPDACINPHPRFGTLTANIRSRRGSKVDIQVSLFQEEEPATPVDGAAGGPAAIAGSPGAALGAPPVIEMDCMAYGMGCCCLQVTLQASGIGESRYLYDQLATLAPVMLALTAATPILQGRLAGTDVRWDVIAASVDDRTPAERGKAPDLIPDPRMAGGGVRRLSKSRYDSVSCYIQDGLPSSLYNDVPCEIDEDIKKQLLDAGVDMALANHLAHLFVRDPLVAFEGAVQEVNDEESMEHFESINSTNWQTVRWKPAPPRADPCGPHIGWRTEFRSMEVQLTDFENAAFTAFVVLVTRALLVFNLNMRVPLAKVDDNMRRAHAIDAVNRSEFWFRRNVLPQDNQDGQATTGDDFEEMTMNEIINGKGQYYPGLVPLCYAYLRHIECDSVFYGRLDAYLSFIAKRAAGELMTPASWIRRFVRQHSEYKKDSVVTQGIAYDLMCACDEIGRGARSCPELLGDAAVEPVMWEDAYDTPLAVSGASCALWDLLRRARHRQQGKLEPNPWSPLVAA